MKRKSLLSLLLLIASVFTLFACDNGESNSDKPEEVITFIDLVDEVGTVTLNSQQAIHNALVYYETLSDDFKIREDVIEYKEKLDNHKKAYDSLVASNKAEEEKEKGFLTAISLLPDPSTITLSTYIAAKSAVAVAEAEYAKLNATSKSKTTIISAYVTLSTLKITIEEVETELSDPKTIASANAYIALVGLIDAVLDLDTSEPAIINAETAYAKLSDAARLVPGVSDAYKVMVDKRKAFDNLYGAESGLKWCTIESPDKVSYVYNKQGTLISYDAFSSDGWWGVNIFLNLGRQPEGIAVPAGSTKITISFKGTAGHTYQFKVEAGQGSVVHQAVVTATGEDQTVVLNVNNRTDIVCIFFGDDSHKYDESGTLQVYSAVFS